MNPGEAGRLVGRAALDMLMDPIVHARVKQAVRVVEEAHREETGEQLGDLREAVRLGAAVALRLMNIDEEEGMT